MNKLIQEVNKKLEEKPLIFFCREVERAIGLETILENYHIACVEDSAMVDLLIKRGFSIFCLERETKIKSKSTNQLLSEPSLKEWIAKITNEKGFYAQTFLPSNTISFKIEQLGGKLLANDYSQYLAFENKIRAAKFFNENGIKVPKNIIIQIDKITHSECVSQLCNNDNRFVVQLERAHTGSGTFIVDSESSFIQLQEGNSGNIVKISEFIVGKTYTLNVCITKEQNYIGPVQYQIPGIPELTSSSGTTVGNDFGKAKLDLDNKPVVLESLKNEIEKLASSMQKQNYRGLFGIDLMINDADEIFIIEINARQTANIPFQTQVELKLKKTPLSLINLASWLEIDLNEVHYDDLLLIDTGSQLFLRALQDNTKIDFEPKSGNYRLLSDNSATNFKEELVDKENVIFTDSDKDKPLVFLTPEYRLDAIENSFLIHFGRSGDTKNKLEEICRMQFLETIVDENDKIKPWILEGMKEIRSITTTL